MTYLFKLYTEWALAYPTSALIGDIVTGLLLVAGMVYIIRSSPRDEKEGEEK